MNQTEAKDLLYKSFPLSKLRALQDWLSEQQSSSGVLDSMSRLFPLQTKGPSGPGLKELLAPSIERLAASMPGPSEETALEISNYLTMLTPLVSDARDVLELSGGSDIASGAKLSPIDYGVTALGALLPYLGGSLLRKAKDLRKLKLGAKSAEEALEGAIDPIGVKRIYPSQRPKSGIPIGGGSFYSPATEKLYLPKKGLKGRFERELTQSAQMGSAARRGTGATRWWSQAADPSTLKRYQELLYNDPKMLGRYRRGLYGPQNLAQSPGEGFVNQLRGGFSFNRGAEALEGLRRVRNKLPGYWAPGDYSTSAARSKLSRMATGRPLIGEDVAGGALGLSLAALLSEQD